MRVIAGEAKGRRLSPVKGATVRPMTDQIRAGVFSSLENRIHRAVVLDLYAGSGAIGIEALSRGADHVTFVERDPAAVSTIRRNLQLTGFDERSDVEGSPVEEFIKRPSSRRFDLVMVDPPFDAGLDPGLLPGLIQAQLLTEAAIVVVRTSSRAPDLESPAGLQVERHRRYGDSTVWYLGENLWP